MIIIKNLLFKLLDEIEPNELLEVKVGRAYHNIYVANVKSILPLATEIRYIDNDHSAIENAYMAFYDQRKLSEYELQYEKDHLIQLDDKEYLILEEIIDIEYKDNYFSVTSYNTHEISTVYCKYDDITAIRRVHESYNPILKKYNKLNYNLKTNR